MRLLRSTAIILVLIILLLCWFYNWQAETVGQLLKTPMVIPKTMSDESMMYYDNLAHAVRNATIHSWESYKRCAWDKDEVHPISCYGSNWMTCLLTLVDALDTLWVMNIHSEFNRSRNWLEKHLQYTVNNDHISVFETTIRILGGLLSAFSLSKDPIFLEKASALGDILLSAFDGPSAFPKPDINFATKSSRFASWTNHVSVSEVSSIQLELNELSRLKQNTTLAHLGLRVYKHLHSVSKKDGLLPIMFHYETGQPTSSAWISLGSRGDSYYEYLLKVWIQTGKKADFLREDYQTAIDGIRKHLSRVYHKDNRIFIGELSSVGTFVPKMDHLVCFLPGTLALGVFHGMPMHHLAFAEDIMKTCFDMYNHTVTGLSPEIVRLHSDHGQSESITSEHNDRHNLLRPETMESLFYLYRLTRKPVYRKWGQLIFEAFENHSRLQFAGYSGLKDVTTLNSERIDKMESFWLSETLKYAYLLFNETAANMFSWNEWLFNTEGHLLPIPQASDSLLSELYSKE